MIYRPQRTENAQGTVKRWGQGWELPSNRWLTQTHPSVPLGCTPVFAAGDKEMERTEVK